MLQVVEHIHEGSIDNSISEYTTTLENLQPGTKYICFSQLKNEYGWSKLSPISIFETLVDYEVQMECTCVMKGKSGSFMLRTIE